MAKYSGNSPAKDVARDAFYGPILRAPKGNLKAHIVIASEECGDIRYLTDHGVPRLFVIACDRSEKARQAAENLGVIVPYRGGDDLETTVEYALQAWGKGNIASINGDLCATIGTVAPIIKRIKGMLSKNRAIQVAGTFCRYRDSFSSDAERQEFWRDTVGDFSNWFAYQSSTAVKQGSPMAMVW